MEGHCWSAHRESVKIHSWTVCAENSNCDQQLHFCFSRHIRPSQWHHIISKYYCNNFFSLAEIQMANVGWGVLTDLTAKGILICHSLYITTRCFQRLKMPSKMFEPAAEKNSWWFLLKQCRACRGATHQPRHGLSSAPAKPEQLKVRYGTVGGHPSPHWSKSSSLPSRCV